MGPLLTKEGDGEVLVNFPIPLLTSPCKGEDVYSRFTEGLMTDFYFCFSDMLN